jgi:hypothetical protein
MWPVAKEDYRQISKEELMVRMEVSLGGYVAEEIFTNTTTSGPCSDLQHVSENARRMIREFGMGSFKFNVDTAFGGRYSRTSPETEREIEMEIKGLVDQCLNNVRELLAAHKEGLRKLAEALVEKETLFFRDIAKILEPERSDIDIEREMLILAEKKLVGKTTVVNLEAIKGLSDSEKGRKKNGKDVNEGKNEQLEKSDQSVSENGPSA